MVGRVRRDGRHDVRRILASSRSSTDRFVAVRVDADRRPDINERYNLGGWPTTVFLTDRGDTLSGGTYLDASQMMAALQQVADAYRDRADEISARSARLRAVRGAQIASRNADRDPRATIAHFRIPSGRAIRPASMAGLDRRQSFHILMRCRSRFRWAGTATASSRRWQA